MKSLKILIPALALFLGSATLQAETVTLKGVGQGKSSVPMPRSGITKAAVSRSHGAPNMKVAAVGKPPISKWVYAEYTVYFEYDRVVHAVPHQN